MKTKVLRRWDRNWASMTKTKIADIMEDCSRDKNSIVQTNDNTIQTAATTKKALEQHDTIWTCDICRIATFDDYFNAEEHEKECAMIAIVPTCQVQYQISELVQTTLTRLLRLIPQVNQMEKVRLFQLNIQTIKSIKREIHCTILRGKSTALMTRVGTSMVQWFFHHRLFSVDQQRLGDDVRQPFPLLTILILVVIIHTTRRVHNNNDKISFTATTPEEEEEVEASTTNKTPTTATRREGTLSLL